MELYDAITKGVFYQNQESVRSKIFVHYKMLQNCLIKTLAKRAIHIQLEQYEATVSVCNMYWYLPLC